MICMGQRIGDEYDDVACELVDCAGVDITLSRVKSSKHTYVTRLPKDIAAGMFKVQMRMDDGSTSNALDLQVFHPWSPPATPSHESPNIPSFAPPATQPASDAQEMEDIFEALWNLDDNKPVGSIPAEVKAEAFLPPDDQIELDFLAFPHEDLGIAQQDSKSLPSMQPKAEDSLGLLDLDAGELAEILRDSIQPQQLDLFHDMGSLPPVSCW